MPLSTHDLSTIADIMAAAGAAMGVGKKVALTALGTFSGVGAAVAYKLDQSGNQSEHCTDRADQSEQSSV